MKWQQRMQILMAPEDGGTGGGEPPAAEGGATPPEGGGSILDLASGNTSPAAEGNEGDAYTPPDYLPEHLRGSNPDETIEKLHNAYKGARTAMAKGEGKLEGAVPDSPDAYSFTDQSTDDAPDAAFAELTSEASKPLVSLAQKAAHKMGIPDKAFEGFMREFVGNAQADGLPIGVSDEDAQKISAEAEMETLTELVGSAAEAKALVNTVSTYAQKLVQRGTIAQADLAEFSQMVGTAESAHLFHRIMTAEFGEKSIPLADAGAGNITATDAYAMHAKASSMPKGAERDQAMQEAQNAMQKAFGSQSSGSVQSSVL